MKCTSMTVLIAFALLGCALSSASENALILTDTESSSTNDEHAEAQALHQPSPPPFIPTEEWQDILPGQAVPAGLHVQVDMQTGVKQAKLMPGQKTEDFLPAPSVEEPPLTAEEQRLREIGPALAKLSDDPVNTSSMNAEQVQQLTEHMAKLWDSMVQDESRAMLELLEKINHLRHDLIVNTDNIDLAKEQLTELIDLLEALEDLIHQTDNARDLTKMHGIEPLLALATKPNTEASDDAVSLLELKVHSAALIVLGAAMQNNRPVQTAVLEHQPIAPVLELISKHCDTDNRQCNTVIKRGLFCLSALMRHHGNATIEFLNQRGLETTMALWDRFQADNVHKPLLHKLATMMMDVLLLATKPNMTKTDHEMNRLEYLQVKVPLVSGLVVPHNMKRLGLCTLADTALATYADMASLEVFGELRLLMAGVCDPLPLSTRDALRSALTGLDENDEYDRSLQALIAAIMV
eukprot:TRINITY_DN5729_c0_g1_i1.p1 TRINITY_DN5729_c0_g1~~TRINITY_DN5729_c0_g1_i1.p1  ORF type:complete len:465 (+),score=96.57 TRINITY_DN5729_c0_g1_i1:45-1439(+)